MANLASQISPGLPSLPSKAGITGGPPCLLGINVWFKGLNSGPFYFGTRVLTSEPSSQSLFNNLKIPLLLDSPE